MSLPENKFDLMNLLSEKLPQRSRHCLIEGQVLIVLGSGNGVAGHSAGCEVFELVRSTKKQTPECCYTVNMQQKKVTPM